MKITCLQENLASAMGSARGAVPSRTTLPILTNFLLRAKDGHLTITGNDLSTVVTAKISAQVEVEGRITLPARRADELIHTIADGVLEISTELEDVGDSGRFARITGSRSTSHFNYDDPEDYPPIPTVETADVSATVSPATLLDGIRRVLPTVAVEDSRPILACMKMEISGKRLCLAGADGYRLSVYECDLEERLDSSDGDDMIELLVPRKTVVELEKLLRRHSGPVETAATQTHAVFRIGDIEVVSAVVKGTFPNFRDLIPSSWTTRIVVDNDALSAAARSIAVFSDNGRRAANLRLIAEHDDADGTGILNIQGAAEQMGFGSGSVTAEVGGDAGRIAFNSGYLADALSALDDSMALEITTPSAPGVLKPAEESPEMRYTHILMPMYVDWS